MTAVYSKGIVTYIPSRASPVIINSEEFPSELGTKLTADSVVVVFTVFNIYM